MVADITQGSRRARRKQPPIETRFARTSAAPTARRAPCATPPSAVLIRCVASVGPYSSHADFYAALLHIVYGGLGSNSAGGSSTGFGSGSSVGVGGAGGVLGAGGGRRGSGGPGGASGTSVSRRDDAALLRADWRSHLLINHQRDHFGSGTLAVRAMRRTRASASTIDVTEEPLQCGCVIGYRCSNHRAQ